jgi:hypothetical protein
VGQGLFFAGLKHVAIQIIASFSEDKIVTTNPEELLAQSNAAAEFETDAAKPEEAKPAETPTPVAVAPATVTPAAPTEPAPTATPAPTPEEKKMEAEFTENVASVLDQAIEAPQSVVTAPAATPEPVPAVEAPAPVAPATPAAAPVQDIPVVFDEKK